MKSPLCHVNSFLGAKTLSLSKSVLRIKLRHKKPFNKLERLGVKRGDMLPGWIEVTDDRHTEALSMNWRDPESKENKHSTLCVTVDRVLTTTIIDSVNVFH